VLRRAVSTVILGDVRLLTAANELDARRLRHADAPAVVSQPLGSIR
jgi:hypothetical protein